MRRAAALALLAVLSAGPAGAEAPLSLRFVAPERYTDAESRYGSGPSLRVTLGEIERIFRSLSARTLRPGESLSVDVLDIDLAGYERPGLAIPNGLRVVTDVGPPRFRLRYALKERGRTVLAAEETVSDLNFLLRSARPGATGAFHYEQELLRDWFRTRIADRQPPRG
ncbi:DUF3016 domain-containing protein [Methylobacterium organophilum]|uniref:DUF3016 domain-containing protein n=1 Tax=Methylobacterium organophilum TaxID=410 RepID=A0ABQ4TE53_METOR|nr:DUF3016 domain-containing protein [Methylobacterium organophilum]GJE28686.1 hypothetical protein LKMONMHP_3559 [Methylobacterium organophilum]